MIAVQVAQNIVHVYQPMILDHRDKHIVTDPDHILDHRTDMIEEILTSTKSMMIDVQTIDLELVIGSIKINMIAPYTTAIGIGDQKVIHLKCTIINNIMVMREITPSK